jgi:hypothetical protein
MSDEDLGTFIGLHGNELEVFALKEVIIRKIPAQYRTVQQNLSAFKEKYGEKQKLIFIFDSVFSGLAPVTHLAYDLTRVLDWV